MPLKHTRNIYKIYVFNGIETARYISNTFTISLRNYTSVPRVLNVTQNQISTCYNYATQHGWKCDSIGKNETKY